ncbi:hypothetical protein SAMN05660691_03363 [Rheinheimera pacifica]|uniref:DUF3829 domain-containing protein n=1 Tax=Rheinheimera pacifica TaxID=173990 RepID=A0A1H6N9H1_9GAMM|nr:hypothetical protein [Rheinheimera pacifica]SEI07521.1 hypothetical protein SAMN05660691_03363 [Rheinheimera pacifica]
MLCYLIDRVKAMSGKFIFALLISAIAGCAANDTRAPDNQNTAVPAAQPLAGKAFLPVATASSILNYAVKIRTQCMYLFSYTGIELLKLNKNAPGDIKLAVSENSNNIHDQLQTIRERAEKLTTHKLERPDVALNSSEDFMLEMENGIAVCSNALISFIDNISSEDFLMPGDRNYLSDDERYSRFKEMMYPQLNVLGMTYAFEVNEYSQYNNTISAQYHFSLLMQHLYQTLLAISQSHFGNAAQLANKEYKAALVTYLDLKTKARKEVDTMVGMHFLLQLSSGVLNPEILKSKDVMAGKDTANLLAEYDEIIAEFDSDFVTLLTELSKVNSDDSQVNDLLGKLLQKIVGHEVARTKIRQDYRRMMLKVFQMMILQKNK